MNIKSLSLTYYRSYKNTTLLFHPKLTIFYGPNGAGKTNLLEAISILSLGKSFRNAQEKDVIQTGKGYCNISSVYEKYKKENYVSYGISFEDNKIKRRVKINNEKKCSRKDIIGGIICVIFNPSDLIIIDGSSLYRRQFVDTILSCKDENYFSSLVHYTKILRQRNRLLKEARSNFKRSIELNAWDSRIAYFAKIITEKRIQFIQQFNILFQETLLKISTQNEKVNMCIALSHPEEEKSYSEILEKNQKKDISLGYTTVGPHRQEIAFEIGKKEIKNTFSQGQKRSLVLALRVAQYHYIKKYMKIDPILLIDDVIGELDEDRKDIFFNLLTNCGQAILTIPKKSDKNEIDEDIQAICSTASIYKIEKTGLAIKV